MVNKKYILFGGDSVWLLLNYLIICELIIFVHRYQKGTALWQNMGYCPQEEALDSFLTVREMLEFFGKMRGLDSETRTTVSLGG